MSRFYFVLVFLVYIAIPSTAETVYLTSGEAISGTVIEIGGDSVAIETEEGIRWIPKEDIEKIEYSDYLNRLKSRNSSLSLRYPMSMIFDFFYGNRLLSLDTETALTKKIAIITIGTIGNYQGDFFWMLQIGPQLRPNGNYLKGFFLGLYPGVGYNLIRDSSYVDWHFMLEFVAGNQWVRDSGFTWGLFQGIRYIDSSSYLAFLTGIHLGFSFKNPLIKAR